MRCPPGVSCWGAGRCGGRNWVFSSPRPAPCGSGACCGAEREGAGLEPCWSAGVAAPGQLWDHQNHLWGLSTTADLCSVSNPPAQENKIHILKIILINILLKLNTIVFNRKQNHYSTHTTLVQHTHTHTLMVQKSINQQSLAFFMIVLHTLQISDDDDDSEKAHRESKARLVHTHTHTHTHQGSSIFSSFHRSHLAALGPLDTLVQCPVKMCLFRTGRLLGLRYRCLQLSREPLIHTT